MRSTAKPSGPQDKAVPARVKATNKPTARPYMLLDFGPALNILRGPSEPACGSVSFFASLFFVLIGGSSNGRTTDSGSVYLGSNPGPPARAATAGAACPRGPDQLRGCGLP